MNTPIILTGTINTETHHEESEGPITTYPLMFQGKENGNNSVLGALAAIIQLRIPITDIKPVPVRITIERLD